MKRRRFGAAALATVGLLGAALVATAGRDSAIARPAPHRDADTSPAIAVAVEPDRALAYPGDAVTVLVTVVNTGNTRLLDASLAAALDGIAVGSTTSDGCEHEHIDGLEPGGSARYACSVHAPAAVFTYGITVTARIADGTVVSDSATVAIGGARAALRTSIAATPAPHRTGEQAAFRVAVRNDGDVPISRVSTLNTTFPGCSRSNIGGLNPGQERSYPCTGIVPVDDATTAIVASGSAPDQPEVRAVSSVASIDVLHPALIVTALRTPRGIAVTVTNVGDTGFRAVRTVASDAPWCAQEALGELASGDSVTYRCRRPANGTITATGVVDFDGAIAAPAGRADSAATAAAAGRGSASAVGAAAEAGSSAEVSHSVELVPTGRAALAVSQRVSRRQARAGAAVTFSITVRNTGNVGLRKVVLRDPVFSACNGVELGALDPGEAARYSCTVPAPAEDVNHVAVVVGEPESGPALTAVSKAVAVDIPHPALAVSLAVTPSTAFPGDSVTWTLSVANVGDVLIRGVTVRSTLGDCSARIGTLRLEATPTEVSCTTRVGSSAATNVVTVTGRLLSGETVVETAAATAAVPEGSGPGGQRTADEPSSARPVPSMSPSPVAPDEPAGGPGVPAGGPGVPVESTPDPAG